MIKRRKWDNWLSQNYNCIEISTCLPAFIYINVNLTRITGVLGIADIAGKRTYTNTMLDWTRRQPRSRGPLSLWRRKTQFAPRTELWLVNFNFSRVDRMPQTSLRGNTAISASSTGPLHLNKREEQSTGNEQSGRREALWEWDKRLVKRVSPPGIRSLRPQC